VVMLEVRVTIMDVQLHDGGKVVVVVVLSSFGGGCSLVCGGSLGWGGGSLE